MPRGTAPGRSGGPGGRGRGGEPDGRGGDGARGKGRDYGADQRVGDTRAVEAAIGAARGGSPERMDAHVRAFDADPARRSYAEFDAQRQQLDRAREAREREEAADDPFSVARIGGGIVGFMVGGPMGAAAGYRAGGALEGLLGTEEAQALLGEGAPPELRAQRTAPRTGRTAGRDTMRDGEGAAAAVLKPGPGAAQQPEEDANKADTPLGVVQDERTPWSPQPVAPEVSFLARVNADIEKARAAGRQRAFV